MSHPLHPPTFTQQYTLLKARLQKAALSQTPAPLTELRAQLQILEDTLNAMNYEEESEEMYIELWKIYELLEANTSTRISIQQQEMEARSQRDTPSQPLLGEHQLLMQQQDEHLDKLSESIGRQKQLGMTIHNELEHHIDMIESTEEHTIRVQNRLQTVNTRLGKFVQGTKGGLTCTIIILVIVLFIVIILAIAL